MSTASASNGFGRAPSLILAVLRVLRCELPSAFCLASSLIRSDLGGGVEARSGPPRDVCFASAMVDIVAVGGGEWELPDVLFIQMGFARLVVRYHGSGGGSDKVRRVAGIESDDEGLSVQEWENAPRRAFWRRNEVQ